MTCKNCGPVNSGPRPFYELVNRPEVLEDHTKVITARCYAAGIIITTSWNVPEKDAQITVHLLDITNLAVGAYLYNPQYGYFKISQWNPETSVVGLINENIAGTAAPGQYVPANMPFLITPKPCCEDDTASFFPFLSEDFEAPPVNQSLTIEVTSIFGLREGDYVRIGSGVYRLEQILSSRQITIKNEGAGVTPGSTVSALDAEGAYQYLIVSENASACSAPTANVGRIIVCDGNLERILNGAAVGQVPVLVDQTADTVQFKFLDADVRICTTLTAGVSITTGNANYVFNVNDTTGFTAGMVFQVNFGSLRFQVDTVTPTQISAHSIPGNPASAASYVTGNYVCKVLSAETTGSDASALVATEAAARIAADNTLQTNINAKVNRAGDTLTGYLVLHADPVNVLGAVPKQYVDSYHNVAIGVADAANANANTRVAKAGDTMTGLLILSGDPVNVLGAAPKQYVDSFHAVAIGVANSANSNANTRVLKAGDTMTGPLVLSGAPTIGNHPTTKTYVDTISTNLSNAFAALRITSHGDSDDVITPGGTISADGQRIYGGLASLLIQNTSPTQNMVVLANWSVLGGCFAGGTTGDYGTMKFSYQIGINIAPIGFTVTTPTDNLEQLVFCALSGGASALIFSSNIAGNHSAVITAGQEIRIEIRCFWEGQDTGAMGAVSVSRLNTLINGIGVGL